LRIAPLAQIDSALATGTRPSVVVRQFGVSRQSIDRHIENHLRPQLNAEIARREAAAPHRSTAVGQSNSGDASVAVPEHIATTVDNVAKLAANVEEQYRLASESGKTTAAIAAVNSHLKPVELTAKMRGELAPETVVNIDNRSQLLRIESELKQLTLDDIRKIGGLA
jgi:hypothetical protein